MPFTDQRMEIQSNNVPPKGGLLSLDASFRWHGYEGDWSGESSDIMPLLKLALVQLIRDWRAGELRLIGLALIIAVASLTSVDFFTDRVNRATEIQATELLAADLVVSSAQPFKQEFIEQARDLGLKTALTVSFRSVIVFAGKLELAEVKAVQPGYPLRGRLQISDQLFSEEITSENIPRPGRRLARCEAVSIAGFCRWR